MKRTPVSVRAGIILLLLACLPSDSQAVVVYANSTASSGFMVLMDDREFGDEITLAGTERFMTDFRYRVVVSSSGVSPNATATVRFYDNTGSGGAPGTLLYSTGPLAFSSAAGARWESFANLSVWVPDTLTWTVQFTGVVAPGVTLPLYNPPTIGSSDDYNWIRSPDWVKGGVGYPVDNYAAELQAEVPEPSVATLVALGMPLMAATRRRR